MANASGFGKDAPPSAVAQTAGVGRTSSMTGSASKVFREFKWGLLTLFLLMVVVIGLVYDGGRKKKVDPEKAKAVAEATPPDLNFDSDPSAPPGPPIEGANNVPAPPPLPSNGGTASLPSPGTDHGTGSLTQYSEPPYIPTNVPPSEPPHIADHINPAPLPPKTSVTPVSDTKTYTVKSGDTLTKIASTLGLGKGGIRALLEVNKDLLSDANRLKPGMQLKIPAMPAETPKKTGVAEMSLNGGSTGPENKNETSKTEKKETAKTDSGKKEVPKADAKDEYVVQSGDTLERIARKLFNDGRRWRDIYEWNRDQISDPGRLRLGQALRIKELTKETSTRAELDAPEKKSVHESKDSKKSVRISVAEPKSEEPQVEVMSRPMRFSDVP